MSKPLRISKTSKKLIDALCETANHAGVQEICGQNTIAQRRFDNAKEDLERRLFYGNHRELLLNLQVLCEECVVLETARHYRHVRVD